MKALKKSTAREEVIQRKTGNAMDVLTKEQRSYNMSQIRGKNTKPEIRLRKLLWALGLRYRLYYRLPGKPDIVFVKKKIAVFVDGCFWHGCEAHGTKPKTNKKFWNKKIQSNIDRDRKNIKRLEEMGWKVLRFWEHDIKKSAENVAAKIYKIVIEIND